MPGRGRKPEGLAVDITIFDPNTVQDYSTQARGTWPSYGIPCVILNGVVVVKD